MFDRGWFNRLYFKWVEKVYAKDPKLAYELDKTIIPELGKKMAKEIKDKLPKKHNVMDYLFDGLKESHWFQEQVDIVGQNDNEIVLQTKECSWQVAWKKRFGELYYCVDSHKAFLEAFCKEFDSGIKVENLLGPSELKDNVYCRWRIYK